MARGPDERSGPQATQPESRLNVDVPAKGHLVNGDMLRQGDGQRSRRRGDGSRRHPVLAPASAYQPLGRRTWVAYSYPCHACHTWHLGRARTLDKVTGSRRAGCGHWVTVMIARLYGHPGEPG